VVAGVVEDPFSVGGKDVLGQLGLSWLGKCEEHTES
jgi:hypothetical protein